MTSKFNLGFILCNKIKIKYIWQFLLATNETQAAMVYQITRILHVMHDTYFLKSRGSPDKSPTFIFSSTLRVHIHINIIQGPGSSKFEEI